MTPSCADAGAIRAGRNQHGGNEMLTSDHGTPHTFTSDARHQTNGPGSQIERTSGSSGRTRENGLGQEAGSGRAARRAREDARGLQGGAGSIRPERRLIRRDRTQARMAVERRERRRRDGVGPRDVVVDRGGSRAQAGDVVALAGGSGWPLPSLVQTIRSSEPSLATTSRSPSASMSSAIIETRRRPGCIAGGDSTLGSAAASRFESKVGRSTNGADQWCARCCAGACSAHSMHTIAASIATRHSECEPASTSQSMVAAIDRCRQRSHQAAERTEIEIRDPPARAQTCARCHGPSPPASSGRRRPPQLPYASASSVPSGESPGAPSAGAGTRRW